MKILIVGGTGPTGYCIVEELLRHGHEPIVFHSGAHERDFSQPIEHIHGDVTKVEGVAAALGARRFDVAINTGGRIKPLLQVLPGRIDKLVAISGTGVYEGGAGTDFDQFGAVIPLAEDAQLRSDPASRFYYAVAQAEQITMQPHREGKFAVSIMRYPLVYGPHAQWRYEWYAVKRALDGRRQLMLPGYGMALTHRGYAANVAHAVVLAAVNPVADGQIYNTGDQHVLSTRQVVDLTAQVFNHEWEIVGIPFEWAPNWLFLTGKRHIVLDLSKLRSELGYQEVAPVEEALPAYLRWSADNPVLPGSSEAAWLGDVFDYAMEDAIIARAKAALAG